jgi:DNA-binding HxlR family transcriptional regulator
VQRTSFAGFHCSIARSLDLVGEWWTPLIVRDLHLGITRFDDLARDLGISRKVLAQRLDGLVDGGIAERRPYAEHPPRYDYVLTERGRDFVPVLLALVAWGDRWTAGVEGPPLHVRHTLCGQRTSAQVTCACCGGPLLAEDVRAEPGPGGAFAPGTAVLAARLAG